MNKKLMEHKIIRKKLKKYDISQKVIESLADAESSSIIFSNVRKGKTIYINQTTEKQVKLIAKSLTNEVMENYTIEKIEENDRN